MIGSSELTNGTKKEVGELLAGLSEQIVAKRSKPMMILILKGIGELGA